MRQNIEQKIKNSLKAASDKVGIIDPEINLEHPDDINHGDFSSNIALVYSKIVKSSPKALAENIMVELKKNLPAEVCVVEIAGPGFINFKIVDSYFSKEVLKIDGDFGKGNCDKGKKVMVEYTDPNPFKIFHIGHLMSNTIGESISRFIEFSGAEVIRANYYGDVGLHVAKTMWALLQNKEKFPSEKILLVSRIEFLGEMYVLGANSYENESVKKEIVEINKKIFEKSDPEINSFYDLGKSWSLEYFETIYRKLGTSFDEYFPESEVALDGVKIVKEFIKKGVFEESQGAIVFPGEKHGLHTRVFINSEGLPTYEAKELGLTKKKFDLHPDLRESVVITANEQSDYFKVLIKTVECLYPNIASRMKHLSHGLLRPTSGKMSSRKGNIVSAENLIKEFESLVMGKMKDREWKENEKEVVAEIVAMAALKYVVLRQAIGGDITYDPDKTVSFEGDSGPYLQYACVRAEAVIRKALEADISTKIKNMPEKVELLERMLVRFPEVIERSRLEYAPHHTVTYLVELSSAFNSYYATNKIIDETDPFSPYRVALTKAFVHVLTNGLWVLGIKVPEKM
ncbi:MAG: arginine--tRNA ligase [Patescibacteria group bacterium]